MAQMGGAAKWVLVLGGDMLKKKHYQGSALSHHRMTTGSAPLNSQPVPYYRKGGTTPY